ncbi:hypothetical protein BC829DRAFT_6493 [Chytridium lagenaria]|nr:hypothetical protein BC829DRAFT_6493 [Chytridium lagenaria]
MSNQMDIDGSHRHDPDLNVPHPPHSKSSRTLDGSASGTSSPAVYITVPEHTLILPYSTSPDFSASTPPFVPHRHQNAISPPSTILGSTSLRPSSPSFHAFPVDSITGVGGVPVAPLPPLPQENRSSPVNEMKTGVARAGGTERSQNGALSTVAASTRLRTSLLKPVRVTRKEGYGMTASHPPPPSPVIGASLEALPAQTVKEDREDAAQKRLSMIAQQQKEYRAVRGSKSSNTSWKLPSVFSGRMGGQTGSSAPIPLGSTVSQAYLAERKRKRRVDVAVASGSATSGWAMFGRQRSGRGRDSQTSGSSLRRFLALTFGIVLGVLGGGLAILQIMGAPMYVLSRFLKRQANGRTRSTQWTLWRH